MQNNGISSQIYSLINNEEFRPTTNLVISTCDAYDYLNNVRPNLEKLTTNYYDTFSITNKFTGYFSNITVGEFFNTLSSKDCDGTAILGGLDATAREEQKNNSSESSNTQTSSSDNSNSDNSSNDSTSSDTNEKKAENIITNAEDLIAGTSSVKGKRGSENLGIAVFDKDKLCGTLSSIETICHLLIKNEIDSCIVSIDNPFPNDNLKKVELSLVPTKKSEISVNINNGIPEIFVKINAQASILTLENNINYEQEEILNIFSSSTEDYLKQQFTNYFNKISKEYNTDIDSFCNKALSHFSTNKEWENFNWSEKFNLANFNIDININVTSSKLITKT